MRIIATDKYSIISSNVAKVTHYADVCVADVHRHVFLLRFWTAKKIVQTLFKESGGIFRWMKNVPDNTIRTLNARGLFHDLIS